ncbi:MAG: hypothetical protein ABIA63_01725 [bacterium]
MNNIELLPAKHLNGIIIPPGDVCIGIAAILLGSVASGTTRIENIPDSRDILEVLEIVRSFKVIWNLNNGILEIQGLGGSPLISLPDGIKVNSPLVCRLLTGLLCTRAFVARIHYAGFNADDLEGLFGLLGKLGANIKIKDGSVIEMGETQPCESSIKLEDYLEIHDLTAIFLAASGCRNNIKITMHVPLPAIGENLLTNFGMTVITAPDSEERTDDPLTKRIRLVQSKIKKPARTKSAQVKEITVETAQGPSGTQIVLPGNLRLSCPFILAALICSNSELLIKDVCLDSNEINFINALKRMQGNIEIKASVIKCPIKRGNITVSSSDLRSRKFSNLQTSSMIWEIPYLAVAAAFAYDRTIIRDAQKLRQTVPDLLTSTFNNLNRMHVKAGEIEDGLIIEGGESYDGADFESSCHFSVGAAFAVAALKCQGKSRLNRADIINSVYPGFFDILRNLSKNK